MKYFSCFSGIGGFELGITQAYEALHSRPTMTDKEKIDSSLDMPDTPSEHTLKPTTCCVGFSEIDKYATQIYQSHFPNHKPYGDITKINTDELPDFDCLVGGFPCQAFSIAGKRKGFEDTRGTLFFELARILRAKQPRLFVFENVKGLLSHDNGKTFSTIIATIDELGYDCQWQVLNSKNHGVPQNRERVFIVGHLRGTARPEVFPFGQGVYNSDESTQEKPSVSPPITTQGGKNCRGVFIQSNESSPQPEVNQPDNSHFIMRATYSDDMRIRRLTPTECERLQGFPDGWTEGVSDTQRYKCLGNAVTVYVIRDIFSYLLTQ